MRRALPHTLLLLLLSLSLVSFQIGCGDGVEEEEGNGEVTETSNGTTGSTTSAASTLELIYISGHFGSYWDCPEEAYDPNDSADDRADGVSAEDADCADPCTGFSSCESAQVSVRLTNTGDDDLANISLLDLLLLDSEQMERASLPVLLIATFEGEEFDGALAAGESVDLRIDFRGPLNLAELLEGGDDARLSGDAAFPGRGAALRLIFKAAEQESIQLDTPEIYEQPPIDT